MISLAWIDDDNRLLDGIERKIAKSYSWIRLIRLRTLEEAKEYFRANIPDGAVFDMRMSQGARGFNPRHDGSKFLLEVSHQHKTMPAFVYSQFLREEHYGQNIRAAYVDIIIDKIKSQREIFETNGEFGQIARIIKRFSELRADNPNNVKLSEYCANPESFSNRLSTHWDLNGKWISKEMEINEYAWCVVVGDHIVESSKQPSNLPSDEELFEIGRGHDLVPFRYGADYLPEEIGLAEWSGTSLDGEDFYPTLRVKTQNEFDADFDTGSFKTYVPDYEVEKSIFDFFKTVPASHLGSEFKKSSRPITIKLLTEDGQWFDIKIQAEVVLNWKGSPFVNVNPNRRMLIGRDVLRGGRFEVILDSRRRISRVREVD